jgi:S1/P1 Nuclease
LDVPSYDPARDCPHDDCVVARIGIFATVLANPNATARDRLEALKFVTHFVGDVHQPLHAEDNHDHGGNMIHVVNYPHYASLHRLWDTDMIEADDPDADHLARRLDASITPAEVQEWGSSGPVLWANESHALAVGAYALLGTPVAEAEITVPESYVAAERPVIELQLERAGIRLAHVLNAVLDPTE